MQDIVGRFGPSLKDPAAAQPVDYDVHFDRLLREAERGGTATGRRASASPKASSVTRGKERLRCLFSAIKEVYVVCISVRRLGYGRGIVCPDPVGVLLLLFHTCLKCTVGWMNADPSVFPESDAFVGSLFLLNVYSSPVTTALGGQYCQRARCKTD